MAYRIVYCKLVNLSDEIEGSVNRLKEPKLSTVGGDWLLTWWVEDHLYNSPDFVWPRVKSADAKTKPADTAWAYESM